MENGIIKDNVLKINNKEFLRIFKNIPNGIL